MKTEIRHDVAGLRAVALDLFGPSDEVLLQLVREGDAYLKTLPSEVQDLLREEPYKTRLAVLAEAIAWADIEYGDESARETAMLVREPDEAVAPTAGEIRWVTGVDVDNPESTARLSAPLRVLLDEERTAGDGSPAARAWHGWVVSQHPQFAGWWDVVLQGDEVLATSAMVQAWNRVTVAQAHLGQLDYAVPPQDLQAVRAVWDEFVSGGPAQDAAEQSGQVGLQTRVTLGGLEIVCGSPRSGPLDQRSTFDSMTRRAGHAVTTACISLLRSNPGNEESWASLLSGLIDRGVGAVFGFNPIEPGFDRLRPVTASSSRRRVLEGQEGGFFFDASLKPTADKKAAVEIVAVQLTEANMIPHEAPFALISSVWLRKSAGFPLKVGLSVNGAPPEDWWGLNKKPVEFQYTVRATDKLEYVLQREDGDAESR